jgi:FAD/FMN-containing dehydrogenase
MDNTKYQRETTAYTAALRTLLDRARGRVVLPGATDYDAVRGVWSGNVNRHPAAVVRAADVQDVILSVNVARQYDLPLAVRSGGHSVAGFSTVDGGLVIDLGDMKALQIDPERRVARAQTGLRWSEYAAAANEFGLATTSGDSGSVGLGGLTTGGGIGWFVRKEGMTIDNVLSAEVVTADGRLVTASPTENEDLFWAIRGGGGNFGVVTSFEYRLHDAGMVVGGALFYPLDQATQVLQEYRAFTREAPEELTSMAMVLAAPPAPFIPPQYHDQLVVVIAACYAGDLTAGQAAVEPLRRLGTPIADLLGPMPYPALFELTREASVTGRQGFHRSMFSYDLEPEMIETALAYLPAAPEGGHPLLQIRHVGGAMSRVPAEATAFPHRDKQYMVSVFDSWAEPCETERQLAWALPFWRAMQGYGSGVYVNFLEEEGEGRIRAAYGDAHYAKLAAIKRRYDPTNLFQLNQNIKPA